MNDKHGRDGGGSKENKGSNKKECKQHKPARVWLASKNYRESVYCRDCLEILHVKEARSQGS